MAARGRVEVGTEVYAGDMTPRETWEVLAREPDAVLLDCRTDAEWRHTGVPDLSSLGKAATFVAWQIFPDMTLNPYFVEQVRAQGVPDDAAVLVICRSGVRSRAAAAALAGSGFSRCYNVVEGFEGDKDEHGHRGTVAGWKIAGLPWIQA